jgi:hypothetical protein
MYFKGISISEMPNERWATQRKTVTETIVRNFPKNYLSNGNELICRKVNWMSEHWGCKSDSRKMNSTCVNLLHHVYISECINDRFCPNVCFTSPGMPFAITKLINEPNTLHRKVEFLQATLYNVRFEIFTAVTMKNAVFWDVTTCGSCKDRRFGGT